MTEPTQDIIEAIGSLLEARQEWNIPMGGPKFNCTWALEEVFTDHAVITWTWVGGPFSQTWAEKITFLEIENPHLHRAKLKRSAIALKLERAQAEVARLKERQAEVEEELCSAKKLLQKVRGEAEVDLRKTMATALGLPEAAADAELIAAIDALYRDLE